MLRDLLEDAGFDCELLGVEPERPNLIARLSGDGPTGRRCACSATSTPSPPIPEDWSHDPW